MSAPSREPATAHVVPKNDLIKHELTDECVCGPEVKLVPADDAVLAGKYGEVVVHQSLDAREQNESQP